MPKQYLIGFDKLDTDACFAASVLAEELTLRTGLLFTPSADRADIELHTDTFANPASESYTLTSAKERAVITGHDRLGLLHGAGALLKTCAWGKNRFELPECRRKGAPAKPVRGVQLGYRPKNNTYDAWTKEQFERHVRECALYGANAIEIMPPITDDSATSVLFPTPPEEMFIRSAGMIHRYAMQVWIWYPNMFKETSEATVEAQLAERRSLFSQIPHIDAISLPGSDPGSLDPEELFVFGERMAEVLREYHPDAKIWISPQKIEYTPDFSDRFYAQVNKLPDWLGGIVYGPWIDHNYAECRRRTPACLPIRGYPDTCHLYSTQYPYHNWDVLWGITVGREAYKARPAADKKIHNATSSYNCGNICYSEGISDDLNKSLWIDQDFDSTHSGFDSVRDYAAMFIDSEYADDFAACILRIEEANSQPVLSNSLTDANLGCLLSLKSRMEAKGHMPNYGADAYRFKMPLLIAMFMEYVRIRAIRDFGVEQKALLCLSEKGPEGISEAFKIYEECDRSPAPQLARDTICLADELFKQIGWQTSVLRHHAAGIRRGAFIDSLDTSLNSRLWYEMRLAQIRVMDAHARAGALAALLNRRLPGPGGRYISFADPDSTRHIGRVYISNDDYLDTDPEAIATPRMEVFTEPFYAVENRPQPLPLSRARSVTGYYGTPVQLVIDGLVPGASYLLKLVFPMRFHVAEKLPILHYILCDENRIDPYGFDPEDPAVYLFNIPACAISDDGILRFSIRNEYGPRGTGAAELWLIKK